MVEPSPAATRAVGGTAASSFDRSSPASAPSLAPLEATAQQDAALLHEARGSVSSNPSRALTLTRDHEVRFPQSPLGEEREALRIEALSRLGRKAEAASTLRAFEAHHPNSPYRRRLRALVLP